MMAMINARKSYKLQVDRGSGSNALKEGKTEIDNSLPQVLGTESMIKGDTVLSTITWSTSKLENWSLNKTKLISTEISN